MPAATEAAILCSKCGVNPRANGNSTNPWCKDCLARYQKEYKDMIAQRLSATAFNAGAEAMRTMLVREFERIGKAVLSGREVAFAIHNSPRPPLVLEAAKE